MEFNTALVKGTLVKRYKRFLADVILENGQQVTAHCPNTGAMTGCAEAGFEVYLRPTPDPKRKLDYAWELVKNTRGDFIGINTHNANKLVGEALQNNDLILPLNNRLLRAEYKPPNSNSRFDFALFDGDNLDHVIEVKSVTLAHNGLGLFPDTRSERATKHMIELRELSLSGVSCTLVFCAQHTGITSVSPARHLDKKYTDALLQAHRDGVHITAVGCEISPKKMQIKHTLSVEL